MPAASASSVGGAGADEAAALGASSMIARGAGTELGSGAAGFGVAVEAAGAGTERADSRAPRDSQSPIAPTQPNTTRVSNAARRGELIHAPKSATECGFESKPSPARGTSSPPRAPP